MATAGRFIVTGFLKAGRLSYGRPRLLFQLAALAGLLALGAGAEAAARTLKVVALGDSLTAGYGVAPGKAFPDLLQAALRANGYDVEVVNAGVSGETAADGLARFDWSVPQGTDALIVELGANDMLRGFRPEVTKTALAGVLDKAKAMSIPVLLTGMRAAPNLGADYGQAYDAIFPDLARTYGAILYPFFIEGVAADPKLNQADGEHPTAEGVAVIVQKILPSAEDLLKRVKP
jgi:acyl-CoA thioesterase I